MRHIALGLALAAFGLPALAQTTPAQLPDGPGKDIVGQACTACHRITAITHLREGEVAWTHQVHDMIQRGAQIQPSEMATVVTYLSTNFGPGVPYPGQKPVQVTLPDGDGKDVVQSTCGACHGLDRVVDTRRTPEQWHLIVTHMVYLGAPLADDTEKQAEDYLSKNLSQ